MSASREVSRSTSACSRLATISRFACCDDDPQIVAHVPGELLHEGAQGVVPGRVDEQRLDPPQGVVARRPGDLPIGRDLLVGFEDLLGHDPRPTGRPGQALEVLAWIGQAVGVVDAEPVDVPCSDQFEQQRVRGVEDVVVLDADRNQPSDVEEPAVVQLGVRGAPVRQPVVLALHEFGQGQCVGAAAHRQHMVVVPQDCLRPGPWPGMVSLSSDSCPAPRTSSTVAPRRGIRTRPFPAAQSMSNHDATASRSPRRAPTRRPGCGTRGSGSPCGWGPRPR